jgi:hypothetical protein
MSYVPHKKIEISKRKKKILKVKSTFSKIIRQRLLVDDVDFKNEIELINFLETRG